MFNKSIRRQEEKNRYENQREQIENKKSNMADINPNFSRTILNTNDLNTAIRTQKLAK